MPLLTDDFSGTALSAGWGGYALEHYFTFSGVAMKAFPAYLLDD